MTATTSAAGFRGNHACQAAGITYRQLDFWDHCGFLAPELRVASGSGSRRLYSPRDVVILAAVRRLMNVGVSLAGLRTLVDALRQWDLEDLAGVTVVSNGGLVAACHNDAQVSAAVRSGIAVFALDLGPVVLDVATALADLPAEVAQ